MSTGYRAIEPELVPLEGPIWQFVIQYKAPTLSPIRVGLLEVNALTGEVLPLTINQNETIRARAVRILPATHHSQQQLTDCLPACVKMVLDYYQVRLPYQQLLRILKTTSDGTPFNNLTLLAVQGFSVVVKNEFDQQRYIGRYVSPLISQLQARKQYRAMVVSEFPLPALL